MINMAMKYIKIGVWGTKKMIFRVTFFFQF